MCINIAEVITRHTKLVTVVTSSKGSECRSRNIKEDSVYGMYLLGDSFYLCC